MIKRKAKYIPYFYNFTVRYRFLGVQIRRLLRNYRPTCNARFEAARSRFSCIKWQVFLRSLKMQKGISKFSADVESLPGEAASCRLALLSRGGVERLIWLRILPHTFRFLYGRETVLPCYARFKAARSRFSCIKCQVLLPASLL